MTFEGTENFKISELEYSDIARTYNINNKIPDEFETNAKRLLEFLQDMRKQWGSGIRITSGYRGPKLNNAVKGSKTSAHLMCNAADLFPVNGKFEEFKSFVIDYLHEGKLWDQCILERSGESEWIHLGLYNNSGKQRKQIFKINND